MNGRCRHGAAHEIAGGLCIFDFWARSGDNPADAPISTFGIRAAKPQPRAASEPVVPTSLRFTSGCKVLRYAALAPILTLGFHHTSRP